MDCLFIGAGDVARQYTNSLDGTGLVPVAVCDLDADRANGLADELGAAAYTDLDAALAAVDAPVAINLTGHGAHADVTRQCLAAGRHVYSEKPLALEPAAAEQLIELASAEDRALGCAPGTPDCTPARLVREALADGRLGRVRVGYAHAHVGRVIDWHDRPRSFLQVGPLYDGAVYPLTLLTSWFGPVERVRVADALDPWPADATATPETPTHLEAMLGFASGPTVRLTASFYVPHRSREFYGLELHGDDGSVYLSDAGALEATLDTVQFGRRGREYVAMPPQHPSDRDTHLSGVERFVAAIEAGKTTHISARRAAHVVSVCAAIQVAAVEGQPVSVDGPHPERKHTPAPVVRPSSRRPDPTATALRLPRIGFGCSRYRGDEYVDRADSIATALDAGYRLLDSAELYGNEFRIGDLLGAPGAPDRDGVFILGKVWRTNHAREHLLEACAGSREELAIDSFDCYTLHWPEAWEHRGQLRRLAEKPIPEQEALTFPERDGEIQTADIGLEEAWRNLERVYERGWARTLGLCNVSRAQLEQVLEAGTVSPALVQVKRTPYDPRTELVDFCHERGIRVIAHSPLSTPGLLDEPILESIAAEYDLTVAGLVLAWHATQGVVPIPSSVDSTHIVENLAAVSTRLSPDDCDRITALDESPA